MSSGQAGGPAARAVKPYFGTDFRMTYGLPIAPLGVNLESCLWYPLSPFRVRGNGVSKRRLPAGDPLLN